LQQRDFDRAAQVDRLPEPKMGKAAAKLEARGIETERGKLLREVREVNQQRAAVYQHVSSLGERAKAGFIDLRRHLGDALQAFRLFSTRAKEWLHEKIGREVGHEVERQQPVRTPKDEQRAEPVGQRITVEQARTIAAAVAASNLPPAGRLVWQLAAEGIAKEAGMRLEQRIAPEARRELERHAEGLRAEARLDEACRGIGPARERAQAQRPHDAELWRGLEGEPAQALYQAQKAADDARLQRAAERQRQQDQAREWRERLAEVRQRQKARDRDRGMGMGL
jgi:hypothetical protein